MQAGINAWDVFLQPFQTRPSFSPLCAMQRLMPVNLRLRPSSSAFHWVWQLGGGGREMRMVGGWWGRVIPPPFPGRLLLGGSSLYQGPEFFSRGSFHMAPSLGFTVFSRVVQLPISGPVSSLFSLNTAHVIVKHHLLKRPWHSTGMHRLSFVLFLLLVALEEENLNHWTTRRVPECINYFFCQDPRWRSYGSSVWHLWPLYVCPLLTVLKIKGQYYCSNCISL